MNKTNMTNYEAKVYIQYIKVLLSIHKCNEAVLDAALDMADKALGKDPVVNDPRFSIL